MADHKKQHFVPRCHFKPFSIDGLGKAISMINVKSKRAIPSSSISGQCFRNFLYGKDLILERGFQKIEGEYARILRRLQNDPNSLDIDDVEMLRFFTALQYSRTESAMRRLAEAGAGLEEEVFGGRPQSAQAMRPAPESERDLMMSSLKIGLDVGKIWRDLKYCILINTSRHEFVTSDDPVVMTNRFHFQKLKGENFGFISAGILIVMPLTPTHSILFYDKNVYVIRDKIENTVFINSDRDVFSLNEFQYLKCKRNIYFRDFNSSSRIINEFQSVESRRPLVWFKIATLVPQETSRPGFKSYRVGTDAERLSAREALVHISPVYTQPTRWLSKLTFRAKPVAYSDGSATGWLRKREWLNGGVDRELGRVRPTDPTRFGRSDVEDDC